ncbi:MAG TPA: hypothetical protein VMR75_00450 [Candidatus Saccharimonadales bacterium]|nr:hypothetical protein [Candidatus Saccharimonadales bacterium]
MKPLRFLLVGLAMLLPTLPAQAASSSTSSAPGQGLEISPPVIELNANPGQTVNVKITLRDITSGPLIVTGQADDFGAKNETGDPEILLDETGATRYSLKYWISNVPSLTLQPQQIQTLSIPIMVPANAEPGGHYGVIRFTGLPPSLSGTGVSLSASLGALILMRVAGKITENLSNTEFFASQNGHKHSLFEYGPLTLSERIHNGGDVHVQPVGHVSVYNMFNHRIAYLAVNSLGGNILPASIRRFDQTLNQRHLFGRYHASYSVVYGDSHKTLNASMAFWVIPWKLILIIVVLVIAALYLARQALRRYNRHIIERAKRS